MTITIRVDLSRYADFEKNLGAMFPEAIKVGFGRAARDSLDILRARTAAARVYDQGGYASGWTAEQKSPYRTIVYNNAPYSAWVELGREPGGKMPPVSAIQPWVQRRLGSNDLSTAFKVARSIAKKGIRPRPVMLEKGMLELMVAIVLRHVDKALTEAFVVAATR